jgi:hypothetical protein
MSTDPNVFTEEQFKTLGYPGTRKPEMMTIPYIQLHKLFKEIGGTIAMLERSHKSHWDKEALIQGLRHDVAMALNRAASEALGKMDMTVIADSIEKKVTPNG